jgi:hypothetical protein
MPYDSDHAGDDPHRWTSARVLLGVVIVLTAATVLTVVARSTLGDRGVVAPFERSLRAVRPVTSRPAVGGSFNYNNLLVPREKIHHGGPPKDGIPALINPITVPAADVGFLKGDARVVGVIVDDEARAYPLAILNWHEAVNDELAGAPLLVVYCPLCDSVSVLDRRLDGETHEFGISGLLYNSNVLLFDRADDSLWSQLGFAAISGPNAGKSLRHLGWEITTFASWSKRHPDSTVVSFETGYGRDYQTNPYADYFKTDRLMFPVDRKDTRLNPKDRIVAVKLGETVKAYPISEIQRAPGGVVRDTIDDQTIVLESDEQTGSVRVAEAPNEALVVHTFWFAWVAFQPQTEVYRND